MGQGEGPAVGDERFSRGWEVFKQAFVHGWALTLPLFFLSVSLPPPKLAPTTQPRVCSSSPLEWLPRRF